MVDVGYKRSCKEVIEILSYIPKEDYKKIPPNIVRALENDKDETYHFKYDVSKTLDEQNVSKQAKTIIAILFRDYWASEYQRKIILENESIYRNQKEEEKREKYNPAEIFKNNKTDINNTKTQTEEISIAEMKEEKWYQKIFNLIKNLFHRSK